MIPVPIGEAFGGRKIEPPLRENMDSTQSTGDWQQLSETFKKLKNEGFNR
jgi:hypothetical protein